MSKRKYIGQDQLILAGIMGLGTIIVVELLGLPALSTSLVVALHCFALAIPCAAGAYMIRQSEAAHEATIYRRYEHALAFSGSGVGFAGIAAVFWHFSWVAGSVFAGMSTLAVLLWLAYDEALEVADGSMNGQHDENQGNRT